MKITNDVLQVLSAGSATGKQYFLPPGQLDRAMYMSVNKVLEAAGGKWNRSAKAHVFDTDAEDRIDQIILTGEVDVPKDEFEFFPTPLNVANRVRELAGIHTGMTVLEPSAGRGALIEGIEGCKIDCVEKMAENAEYLRQHFKAVVIQADFMEIKPEAKYDAVLMNPPFSKRQDIKHVNHAKHFLKDGGTLVAVMSVGVLFRQDKLTKEFRESVSTIESLPNGAFKESGTMVNTVIVTYKK